MGLEPMQRVIHNLQEQQTWQQYRQFQNLLVLWEEVVGQAVAAQTRPLWITPQRVLKVATSGGTWAQNLTFERHRILGKLNTQLAQPLSDVHFSSQQWLSASLPVGPSVPNPASQRPANPQSSEAAEPEPEPDLTTAFENWSMQIRQQSKRLPLCPKCQCPTPTTELSRWSLCSLCAARN